MSDDIETLVQGMGDDEALPNPEAEAAEASNVETTESATQDRNPDGTFKASESDDDASDDTVDEAAAETGESETASDETEIPEQTERRRGARERIGQLTAQRNEARARADMLEAELREYRPMEVDPEMEFNDPAGFTQAAVQKALQDQNAQSAYKQAEQARQFEMETARQMFSERLETMRDELPDFDQVFTPNTPVSDTAVEFLAESEIGPRIAHHLGKNLSLAHRIAAMPPVKQGVELARLESKLSATPERRQTKAPKPASTISGGGSSGAFDPSTASVDDIAKQLGYGS